MEKLVDVNQLFSPAAVTERIATLNRFWAGEDMGRPLVIGRCWGNQYRRAKSPREAASLFVESMITESQVPWDALPYYDCHTYPIALATAFGGEIIESSDASPWIEPIIVKPEDVYEVKCPDPLAGQVGEAVRNYKYTLDQLEGYLPPRVPDMQGPLMLAAMLWRQEDFLLAMYDHPEEVHHLLSIVTDHIIAVYRYFKTQWPQAMLVSCPSCYMPQSMGVGMIEDFMHLLPPDLYREFGLPYVNRISREFGGIFIHCCGVFKQHWPIVKEFHNLRGLDTQYPYSHPEEVFAAFPDIVHSMTLDFAERRRNFSGDDPDAFLKFYLSSKPKNARWMLYADADDLEGMERMMDFAAVS